MSEIIERNKTYLVKSEYGNYTINNRHSAEQLNATLTNYETIAKQHRLTEQKLDNVTKQIIRMQMTLSTLNDEVQILREELAGKCYNTTTADTE